MSYLLRISFVSLWFFLFIGCTSDNDAKKDLSEYNLDDSTAPIGLSTSRDDQGEKLLINFSVSTSNDEKTTLSKSLSVAKDTSKNLTPFERFNIKKIMLDIKSIEAHNDVDGWIVLDANSSKLDLLQLQNGISSILFNHVMPVGQYSQIRLFLGEHSEVIVNNRAYHLEVPSGQQTGVKLVTEFTIANGENVEVKLDINLLDTLSYQSGKGFSLKPTITIKGIQETSAGGLISADGGSVATIDNAVNLSIPASSLSTDTVITIDEINVSAQPELINADNNVNTGTLDVYEFGPDGQTFEEPVLLTFTYSDEEIKNLASAENLHIAYFNESTQVWEELNTTVNLNTHEVYAYITHFSIFGKRFKATHSDKILNSDETGVDCGGSSGIPCHECLKEDSFGNATDSTYFSLDPNMDENIDFNDQFGSSGESAYREAKNAEIEYAKEKGIQVDEIDTVEEKIEAVSFYLYKYMGYMLDYEFYNRPKDWMQDAGYTAEDSMYREGFPNTTSKTKVKCTDIDTKGGEKAKFCGDCEDHAVFRESMLRYLGVSSDCAYVADYQPGISHPSADYLSDKNQTNNTDYGSGIDDYHDYYNATDLDYGSASFLTDAIDKARQKAQELLDEYNYKKSLGCELVCEDGLGGEGSSSNFSSWASKATGIPETEIITITTPDGTSSATSEPIEEQTCSNYVWVCPQEVEENEVLQGFFTGDINGTGHSFNIVVYNNRYRILDYYPIGMEKDGYENPFWESGEEFSEINHRASNIWNDKMGAYLAKPWTGEWTNPGKYTQNISEGGINCYETGKDHWSAKTLYYDYCK